MLRDLELGREVGDRSRTADLLLQSQPAGIYREKEGRVYGRACKWRGHGGCYRRKYVRRRTEIEKEGYCALEGDDDMALGRDRVRRFVVRGEVVIPMEDVMRGRVTGGRDDPTQRTTGFWTE